MQARVTCPACQTMLGVSAACGEGTLLRCPQCRHEFAIRVRPQVRPPATLKRCSPATQTSGDTSGSGSSLLWIGLGGGAALAVACVVLVFIVVQMAAPPAPQQDAVASDAQTGAPVTESAGTAPAATAPATVSADRALTEASTPAPQPVSPPAVVTAPMPSNALPAAGPQQASSVTPSPFARPEPAPPSGMVVPGGGAAAQLVYRFASGEEYVYSFNVKADIAGTSQNANGSCTLTPSREAAPAEFAQQRTGQGNGSGFVVTSDGYIVTCAHVVEDSTKLEVVLGSQTYPAQVVAFDKEHDLAIIHVAGANLPTLPLANSDNVQLAEEVRAVGFPLSNVLGDSVKITRGTIAGVVNTSGHKLFQVDASINPGNSGGPLVNEQGEVVGVASAKIAREDVDGVGFVVPANEVLTLLRSKGISPPSAGTAQKLDGPALAQRVTPAVALIKLTLGPGGFGSSNRLALDFSGHVISNGAPRVVGRMTMPGFPNIEHDRGKLLVSERGELLNYGGSVQLPYLLGPVGAFPIEPLGGDNQRSWRTQQATTLTQTTGAPASGPFSIRFRHRSRSPFGQSQTQVVVTPAMETSTYELGSTSGHLATIRKQYTFETLGAAGSAPVAKMTGDGTLTFNLAKGYAEKMDFKATLVRTVSNVTVTVPLSLEWHRLSPAEVAQMREQAKANQQAAAKVNAGSAGHGPQSNAGEDTEFVGGDGGGQDERIVDETSFVYGIECKFSEWMGQQCVNRIAPLFSRDQERNLPVGAVAREGYAVGAAKVYGGQYVNALQLVFMRVKDNGQLDPSDSYTSAVLGGRMRVKPRTLTGKGAPIIGIHVRRGLVVDALALVVNREAEAEDDENPFESSGKKKSSN